MTGSPRRLLLALSTVLLGFAAACADAGRTADTPMAAGPSLPAFQTGNTDLGQIARFRAKPQVTVAWARTWIGPQGGRLDFQGFAIDVPAGAVDRVTMFSIRLPVDPNGSQHVIAEFGPHNQRFLVPVSIELPLRGTSIEGDAMATVVRLGNGWEPVGGTPTADGTRLRTEREHFSVYGTSSEERGGGTMVASGG